MKQFSTLLFFLLVAGMAMAIPTEEKRITVYFEGGRCEKVDSLSLFQFNGMSFERLQKAARSEEPQVIDHKQVSVYQFDIASTEPRFYYIGVDAKNMRPIVLGTEDKVRMRGTCMQMRNAQVLDSELNTAYTQLRDKLKVLNSEQNVFIQRYRKNRDADSRKEVIEQFARLDQRRIDLIDSLKQTQPYLAKIAALQTYLSFHNYGEGYASEVDYFTDEFFHFVDWKDADYNYMSWVYESVKSYAETISTFGLSDARHKEALDALLAKVPEDSRAKQLVWSAIITGLQSKTHSNFAPFATSFVETYKDKDPQAVAAAQQKIKQARTFMTGVEAPDFEMANLDGEMVKLSDFKGKVLLVDFWASWCGPCRRENPKVVRLYEAYKDKGFEILGVSLDSKDDRWKKAIVQDKLTWPQVSDLKGWQNAAAKMYGVRSIPTTLLLDAEGKIIGRNYRGPALEAKLKEVLGE